MENKVFTEKEADELNEVLEVAFERIGTELSERYGLKGFMIVGVIDVEPHTPEQLEIAPCQPKQREGHCITGNLSLSTIMQVHQRIYEDLLLPRMQEVAMDEIFG